MEHYSIGRVDHSLLTHLPWEVSNKVIHERHGELISTLKVNVSPRQGQPFSKSRTPVKAGPLVKTGSPGFLRPQNPHSGVTRALLELWSERSAEGCEAAGLPGSSNLVHGEGKGWCGLGHRPRFSHTPHLTKEKACDISYAD